MKYLERITLKQFTAWASNLQGRLEEREAAIETTELKSWHLKSYTLSKDINKD